jgi:hypothetical protein
LKDDATIAFDGLMQDGMMACKQPWHLLGVLLREPGAAFDIREEERDSAGRELVLVSH